MSAGGVGNPLWVGLRAARANVVPGLIVQGVMAALVVGYYFYVPSRVVLETMAGWKGQAELPFAVISTVIAGAVLPEILKVICFQGGRVRRGNWRALGVLMLMWGAQGIIVNGMYQLQTQMFGDGKDVRTIVCKVGFDQFLFNPLFAAIVNTAVYNMLHVGFTWGNVRECLTWRYYKANVIPVLLATWGVWVPVVALVYMLPAALQFVLFLLALTFWANMLAFIGEAQSRRRAGTTEVNPDGATAI